MMHILKVPGAEIMNGPVRRANQMDIDWDSIERVRMNRGAKGEIVKIGTVDGKGNLHDWEFDCHGYVPGIEVMEEGSVLYAGWTVEELREKAGGN